MDKNYYNAIAEAIEQFNYYNDIIEKAKEEIRNLSEEEVAKINKNTNLHIDRKDYTKTTYSAEYKAEVEKLKAKFPATKETFNNYTITLSAESKAIKKAEEVREIAKNNITTLRKMSASINKNKQGNICK